ncbi:hypothetical protein Q7P37_010515 [Cladosporium fusiforme]
MTDLLTVLPHFDSRPYTHILPSLEKALVSCADLLTLDATHVAKRAQVPPGEVKKLADSLVHALSNDSSVTAPRPASGDARGEEDPRRPVFRRGDALLDQWTVSTLDDKLDTATNGGVHSGYLTEITGESAAGKTQFLLTLLLSAQLNSRNGSPRNALYISTEAQLQTTRLNQILTSHPKLADLQPTEKPTLARIQSTRVHDLEAQEHILRYQVPVAIERFNVGLVVVDSIAANYRAEFAKGGKPAHSLAKRSTQVAELGAHLRNLARSHNIAIVVANQVADRFEAQSQLAPLSQQLQTQTPRAASPSQKHPGPAPANPTHQPNTLFSTTSPLDLDHQQRFFTGWGDNPFPNPNATLKTPSLGLTWTNQLATRIALLRSPIYEARVYQPGEDKAIAGWKRALKVVFSAWCAEGETEYEIWQGGVRGIVHDVGGCEGA